MAARLSSLQGGLLRNAILLALALGASMVLLVSNIYSLRREVRVGEQSAEHSRESAESYRHLSGRILAVQDAERRKLGRELHDSVGQQLTGVQMLFEQVAQRSDPKDAGLMREALKAVQDTSSEVRTLSQLLHPPLLEVAGFVDAASSYAEQFGRRSGIKVNVDLPGDVKLPSKDAELMLFRVLQESLTNVHRHARATAVDISLAREKDRVVLTIHDNGKGLAPGMLESFNQGVAIGVGLAGKRERLAEFGGTLELQSSDGTTVRASLPG